MVQNLYLPLIYKNIFFSIDLFIEDEEDVDNQSNKYLMFNPGDEEYGIDIARITAIE